MSTPFDDPRLYDAWEKRQVELVNHYRRTGRVRAFPQAWRDIASEYGTTYEVVRGFLWPDGKYWCLFNLHLFLPDNWGFDEELTWDDACCRVTKTCKSMTETWSADRAIQAYEKRFGVPLVRESAPGKYRLNGDLWRIVSDRR